MLRCTCAWNKGSAGRSWYGYGYACTGCGCAAAGAGALHAVLIRNAPGPYKTGNDTPRCAAFTSAYGCCTAKGLCRTRHGVETLVQGVGVVRVGPWVGVIVIVACRPHLGVDAQRLLRGAAGVAMQLRKSHTASTGRYIVSTAQTTARQQVWRGSRRVEGASAWREQGCHSRVWWSRVCFRVFQHSPSQPRLPVRSGVAMQLRQSHANKC